jgi:hypothetical protein
MDTFLTWQGLTQQTRERLGHVFSMCTSGSIMLPLADVRYTSRAMRGDRLAAGSVLLNAFRDNVILWVYQQKHQKEDGENPHMSKRYLGHNCIYRLGMCS